MNKRKIAIISPARFPGLAGDTANSIELINQLIHEGYETLLLCPKIRDSDSGTIMSLSNACKVIRVPIEPPRLDQLGKGITMKHYLRLLVFLLSELITVLSVVSRMRIKMVYMRHGILTMHLPIFLRLLGVKVIADGELFSDSLDNLHANRLLSNLLGTYEHKVLGLYNLFKVSTQFHAQTLERIGLPKNRILLIPMSVNINAIPKFAITDIPEHTFGYFGALEHWQGPDLLLNSFKLLLQSMPNAKLYIIGEGSMKKKLEHMIASVQLADNIIMVGGLPRQAIWEEYFRRFRILVIPRPKLNNSTDALPSIKLIEAFAAGKVVIATDIPAMREVPADSIFLVPPGDSESLAKAMHSLSNDESELQRYSSAALNASHHYDIRSNFKQLISALENL